jgi:hypothetical protein
MKQIVEDFMMYFENGNGYVTVTAYNNRRHRISIESRNHFYPVVDVTVSELKQLKNFLNKTIEKIESDKDFNKEH